MNRAALAALCLALGAASARAEEPPAPTPAPAAEPATPAPDALPGDVSGEGKPPPGSAEDQALWSEALSLTQRITTSRSQATKLQWEARSDRYDDRLGERARQETGPGTARLLELQKLYRTALATNYTTLTRRWPVDPTRGCQYPMLHLASAMRTGKAELLGPSRADARSCVEKARQAVEVMEASNADLERMAGEAARALGPASPARGEAGAAGTPARE